MYHKSNYLEYIWDFWQLLIILTTENRDSNVIRDV